jgi:hypothetical protein
MSEFPTQDELSNALQNPVRYQAVFKAIESDAILEASPDDLMRHAKALCVFHFDHQAQDQTAAALFIHGMILSRIAERFETVSKKTTRLVIVLTCVAVVAGLIQAAAAVMGIWPN